MRNDELIRAAASTLPLDCLLSVMVKALIIATVLSFSGVSFPQTQKTPTPQIWGDPDGFTGCDVETTTMLLDFVVVADREGDKNQSIIIVARRGRGERSNTLIKRRLRQVSDYLARKVPKAKIIATQGAPLNGLGRLEFYVAGRLHTVIKIKRNRDLVTGCPPVG